MSLLCSICNKLIKNDAIFCNSCELWVHPKCNRLNADDFKKLVQTDDSKAWSCYKCNCTLFPLNTDDSYFNSPNIEHLDFDSSLTRSQFYENSEALDCRYYDSSTFNDKFSTKSALSSFFHLNINSLNLHFDELEVFLNSLNCNFDVIGLSETRILFDTTLIPSLPGYKSFCTPTKALHGGTSLFISDKLNSCRRSVLESIMNSPKLLESTFAEINQFNRPNIVVGTIYRHHALSPHEFSHNFLLPFLEKINRQGKLLNKYVLLGDFNLNLINSSDNNISEFIDILEKYLLLPYINLPTRITNISQTLIDNIFISPHSYKSFSGNFITGISDHLAQFFST